MTGVPTKAQRAFCRKLYLAGLIAAADHNLATLSDVSGMPRRTVQVRRPINRDGVGQWQPYREWLGPLFAALGDLPETYARRPQDTVAEKL